MKVFLVWFFIVLGSLGFQSYAQKIEKKDDVPINITRAVYLHPQQTYDITKQAMFMLGADTLSNTHNSLLIVAGRCAVENRDIERAIGYYHRVLVKATKMDDLESISSAHLHLSNAYLEIGKGDLSRKHASVGFAIALENRSTESIARGLYVLAKHYRMDGNYAQSLELFEQSAFLFLQLGDSLEAAQAYNGLASVYSNMDYFEESITFYNKALKIFIKEKSFSDIATLLANIGLCYVFIDQYDKAYQYMKHGLRIRHKIKDVEGLGSGYSMFSTLHHVLGEHETGNKLFRVSVKYSMQSQSSFLLANAFYSQAEYLEWAQDTLEAIMCYQNSLEFSKDIQYREMIILSLQSLVDLFAGIGEFEKAYNYMKELSDYEDFQFNPHDESNMISLAALLQPNTIATVQSNQKLVMVMGGVLLVFLSGVLFYQASLIRGMRKKLKKK